MQHQTQVAPAPRAQQQESQVVQQPQDLTEVQPQQRVETAENTRTKKTRIKASEVVKLTLQGIFGAVVAVGVSYALKHAEGKVDKESLMPQPENFDRDVTSYKLFRRLGLWRDYHEESYVNCLRACDNLLGIERALSETKTLPLEHEDMARAAQNFKAALLHLDNLVSSIFKVGNATPQSLVELEYDVQSIREFLQTHFKQCTFLLSIL